MSTTTDISKATSYAEQQAKYALTYPAFRAINLENIKSKVEAILNQIGKNGVFGEYTKHDITHIDRMLESLTWLIPQKTKETLTHGEWLMIVLSFYFHDLGMLVTKEEFAHRNSTDYKSFYEKVFNGDLGTEYKKKVQSLNEEQETFLYQEFVRKKHAERIRLWITGKGFEKLGASNPIVIELQEMLGEIEPTFKRDLALICESHHLMDLDDTNKYKVKQSYGTYHHEQVNLQYCAVLLRTADLLHITYDRTPSIEYYLISPSDPISQIEWAKQMAVKNVRAKDKLNKEGIVDRSLQSDTVEVIAYFNNPNKANSFFGLIDYLHYAKEQLKQANLWINSSNKKHDLAYEFPYKDIDDSLIETEGFERKLFEFVLDQQKILSLLVGHTLYNDSSVVLRELIQNSVDAIKLYNYDKGTISAGNNIKIHWSSSERKLSIIDTGTGMTQEVIENHLLKVGSSRYQDEGFKKKYPFFSPISRFGIGILTCFLIADDIEILTVTEEEEKAKKISIRKVDGKYLLQHIDKSEIPYLSEHGTEISLFVREDVTMNKLEENLRKWVVFPPCKVELILDEHSTNVGFETPKTALEFVLEKQGYDLGSGRFKVVEEKNENVTLAYALQYYPALKEWSFLYSNQRSSSSLESELKLIGTSIEGIKVEFNSPGFKGIKFWAIANVTGNAAPKTNVARSHFEQNKEYEDYLSKIYDIYIKHIEDQINELNLEKNYSLTWAVNEGYHIMSPIIKSEKGRNSLDGINNQLLIEKLSNIQCILVENEQNRKSISSNEAILLRHLWTIDSELYRNAEYFLREVHNNASITGLLNFLTVKTVKHDNIFCGYKTDHLLHKKILEKKEVDTIIINQEQRRIDLRWINCSEKKIWRSKELSVSDRHSRDGQNRTFYLQLGEVEISPVIDVMMINSFNHSFIPKGNLLYEILEDFYRQLDSVKGAFEKEELEAFENKVFQILFESAKYSLKEETVERHVKRFFREESFDSMLGEEDRFFETINKSDFFAVLIQLSQKVVDNSLWYREKPILDDLPF